MAQRMIVKKGDPVLEKHCRPVTEFNVRLHTLLDDMKETLAHANGVGLAAPQVGVLRRAVIVLETNVAEDEDEYMIELVNPARAGSLRQLFWGRGRWADGARLLPRVGPSGRQAVHHEGHPDARAG